MRTVLVRLGVAAALLSSVAFTGVFATASYAAEGGTICTGNEGTKIKLSPGLRAPEVEEAQVQNVTIKGFLTGCTGSTVTEAKYIAHLKTNGPVDCSVLTSGETATGTIVIKWKPKGQGNSHGTVSMTVTGSPTVIFGKIESGPFEGLGLYAPITPTFGTCGGKKLKKGTFTGTEFRVTGSPKATIESPADEGVYAQGAVVETSFSCTENVFGPGLESCIDSNGASGGSGLLETATPGPHTYTVTARSIDGQKDKAAIHYEVEEEP